MTTGGDKMVANHPVSVRFHVWGGVCRRSWLAVRVVAGLFLCAVPTSFSHAADAIAEPPVSEGDLSSSAEGVAAYFDGDFDRAFRIFGALEPAGDPLVLNNLGVLYFKGRGVSQDFDKAAILFRRAAELGDPHGQFNLATMAADGRGMAKDSDQARFWYEKAAGQGFAKAENNLGSLYQDGDGVERDYARAAAWYRRAAERGYARAQFNLAVLYQHGLGVAADPVEAARLMALAAADGDDVAMVNLAQRYMDGDGVGTDLSLATLWLTRATAAARTEDVREAVEMAERRLDALQRLETTKSVPRE